MQDLLKHLSVVSTALSSDARHAARLARAGGFAGLLFDAYSTQLSFPELSATGRREFLQVLRAQDVQFVGLQGDLGPKGLGPGADVDRVLDQVEHVIESAAALNTPLVCIDAGPLPSDDDQNSASQLNAALIELGLRAERYSVMVAFSSSLASFESLQGALASARCPWFGIDLDPVAILRDAWQIDEFFSRLGTLIRHVRIRDAVRSAHRRTKSAIVGKGDTDWPALLAALDHAGYSGWLTIDPLDLPDRNDAATAARQVLLKLAHASP
jgi:sugar phosphate isomerase/epimerase